MRAAPFLFVLLLTSCATPTYDAMRSEREIPEFDRMLRLSESMPESVTMVPVTQHMGSPVRLAVRETPSAAKPTPAATPKAATSAAASSSTATRPSDRRLIVLIHGVFSNSRLWRYMRGDLAEDADVMTIDLIGCGESDAPLPLLMAGGSVGPRELARMCLIALRDRLIARGGEEPVTIVGHSLGGMITLRMFSDPDLRREFADVLGRVDSLALLSAADASVERQSPQFEELISIGEFDVDLGARLGILKERVAKATVDGVADPDRATREEADRFIDIMVNRNQRTMAQQMIREAVPFQKGRPDWNAIHAITRGYSKVTVPTVVLWGEDDETLGLAMGYKLAAELPDARLRIVPDSMHSLPCERPAVCCQIIRGFIATKGRDEPTFARVNEVTGELEKPRSAGGPTKTVATQPATRPGR